MIIFKFDEKCQDCLLHNHAAGFASIVCFHDYSNFIPFQFKRYTVKCNAQLEVVSPGMESHTRDDITMQ